MDNNKNSHTPSSLDMDVRPPYAMQVRSEGAPSDIITTGLATAIVFGGIGLGIAASKAREWIERS